MQRLLRAAVSVGQGTAWNARAARLHAVRSLRHSQSLRVRRWLQRMIFADYVSDASCGPLAPNAVAVAVCPSPARGKCPSPFTIGPGAAPGALHQRALLPNGYGAAALCLLKLRGGESRFASRHAWCWVGHSRANNAFERGKTRHDIITGWGRMRSRHGLGSSCDRRMKHSACSN